MIKLPNKRLKLMKQMRIRAQQRREIITKATKAVKTMKAKPNG